ncbi:peptide ABC transporter substrate-binding protein [Croceicoccus naphthovorans]|uniref:Uncharacterized protein n=1 Tax=Croceicoccus naphthovorans TaxID=1348774 RepID=A0A0G3XDD7_9SPHN|nr:peptide ABC transporter substrate-binding protein [Croceicoccus naphthovorans]AKM09545.1 hypothetical protein AB433_05430 [Croceicoccus naphthovorans]MBB3989698.1 oligopeptide transport system substrate-binding protein [Croceicoccus naphthovorans]
MTLPRPGFRTVTCTLLAAALAACGSGGKEADQAIADKILLVGNEAEPKTLDSQINTGMPEARIVSTLCEGLTQMNATDDTKLAPGAAASWEPNDDFSQWTFHMQPNGKWSDGTPVKAEDFVYSWQRILTPALGAQYAEMLYVIKGAEAFNRGQTTDFGTVGVKALDDMTLQVDLVGPTPFFAELVKHHSFFPVPPKQVQAGGGMADRANDWASGTNFVCNGPFKMKEWSTNKLIEVEKNPNYWDAANVALNGIRFYPIENSQTETAMFMGGQLHITSGLQLGKFPIVQKTNPDELRSDPFLALIYMSFNTTRKPFDDLRVRKALSMTIDRKAIIDNVLKAGQTPATGLVPAALTSYPTSDIVKYDEAEAKKLLAEAGYPGGKGFPPAEILTISNEDNRKLAEIVQGMWRQKLGVEFTIYNQEWKVYLATLESLDFDVSFQAWSADYAYPTTFLDIFTSNSGNNHTGWKNAQFDSLIDQARVAPTEAERMKLLSDSETVLLNDAPVAPLYWPRRNYLVDTRVKGVIPRALSIQSYKDISFE